MHTILFVDDNEVEQHLIASEIEDQNLKIKPVFKSSAEEALQYLEDSVSNGEKFPDFIVLDIHMSGLSGDEFIEQFETKYHSDHPKTSLYYLSNTFMLPDEDDIAEFVSLKGAFEKPFTKEIYEEMMEG